MEKMPLPLPFFLKREGDALLYDVKGEFVFYVLEDLFDLNVVEISGSYVELLGVCDYALFDDRGNILGEVKPFRFPSKFTCKPYLIDKAKGIKLGRSKVAADYRVLHFKKGDEIVSNVKVPQDVKNSEDLFRVLVLTGKFPTTIPYDKGHEYFVDNGALNGVKFGINMQLFGMLWSELCRDPKDISKPFCTTEMSDMNNYKPVSIKAVPKYVSPYVAITSENWDESLRSAMLIDEKDAKYSPLEKVVMQ